MYQISTEGYKNANTEHLIIRKTDMNVKNISDLVLKQIHGVFKTKQKTLKRAN